MNFQKKLDNIVEKNRSLVCVGLDSDYEKIPQGLKTKKNPLFIFNKKIIDATYDLVCAYKPNSAFYEGQGENGIRQLKLTCGYLRKKHPSIPIILDAKRADIGNTNCGYIKYVFDFLGVDAITVHPYLGMEAILPFLELEDKGFFILCRTSNKGAGEIQDLKINNKPLYNIIANKVIKHWNKYNNCMLVIGATYPKELAEIRSFAGDLTFLIPGIGAQGGDIKATIKAGLNSKNSGMIINSSRSIIFASAGWDFAKKAREKTKELRDEINKHRQ